MKHMVYPGESFRVVEAAAGSYETEGDALIAVDDETGSVTVGKRQALTAAGAIDLAATYVSLTGPSSSTYAVTLAAPTADEYGQVKVIEMIATTSTNAVTLALTNVVGGSAATTATFNAADETLVLVGTAAGWCVLKESGVTLA